ncbi:MAG: UDP-N-acetylenolpyruvoylglucosamine reductase, partial [Oscillospiraceae bacterium]
HSFFSDKNLCILSAEILLKKEDSTKIKSLMDEYITRRKNKQPLEYASGGSTFKRPIGNYAGTLIEQCGLKGYTIGDAMVSTKHCGFIINKGNASYQDVINLIEYVKQVVFKKTGYQLECEIKCVKG